jgi:hypothetical protein
MMSGRSSEGKKNTFPKAFTNVCPLLLFLLATSPALAIKVPRGMDTCPSLKVCLQLLDTVISTTDEGEGSNSEVLARDLSRFGDAAKHELLNRAVGSQPGWRNVAGAILSDWPSWDPSDVPALRKALLMDPGGWVARPLGRIASPEAIEALVEDLPRGEGNQTDFALSHLGASAIPYLFPLLRSDSSAASAARVISAMDPLPLLYASGWVSIALDPSKKFEERIAALRGIAALGPNAKPACADLHKLLGAPETSVRREAAIALHSVYDPSVIVELAQQCRPHAETHDSLAIDAVVCLRDIADFGSDGRDAGPYVLPFLSSKNGAEQAYGILALGLIGYDDDSTTIEAALRSPDWRIVNAAVWSLGWLGDGKAIPQLDAIASSYWLPEVRQNAKRSAEAIRSPTGRLDTAEWKVRDHGVPRDPFWYVTDGFPRRNLECKANRWRWKGAEFKLAHPPGRASSLRFRKESRCLANLSVRTTASGEDNSPGCLTKDNPRSCSGTT